MYGRYRRSFAYGCNWLPRSFSKCLRTIKYFALMRNKYKLTSFNTNRCSKKGKIIQDSCTFKKYTYFGTLLFFVHMVVRKNLVILSDRFFFSLFIYVFFLSIYIYIHKCLGMLMFIINLLHLAIEFFRCHLS